MRQALNENPMVQMAVLGIVGVVLAVLLFTKVLKKDPEPPAPSGSAPAAAASAEPAPATGAPPAPVPETATPPVTPPADGGSAAPPAPGADGLLPTKGLPKDLLVAYAKDKTIALLVIDPKAQQPMRHLNRIKQLSDQKLSVFVVDVDDIADYSRVTSGVSVSRTPALVTIRPRKLTDSVPTAEVKYGLVGPKSVQQAIADADYDGGTVPPYPTGD